MGEVAGRVAARRSGWREVGAGTLRVSPDPSHRFALIHLPHQGEGPLRFLFQTEWVRGGWCRNAGAFHPIRPEAAPRPTFPIKGKDLSRFIDKGANGVEDGVDIVIDLVVPGAEDDEAFASQPGIAPGVPGGMVVQRVLSAIEFDDESWAKAGEVDDVATQRNLSPEFDALAPPGAQAGPEPDFMRRHVLSQGAGALGERAFHGAR